LYYIIISYNLEGGNGVRKLVLLITIIFSSTILLRYTIIAACPDNRIVQDYLNKYGEYQKSWDSPQNIIPDKSQNKKNIPSDKKDASLDNDKKDFPKSEKLDPSKDCGKDAVFHNPFNSWYSEPSKYNYNFSQPQSNDLQWNTIEPIENESLTSKASDIKEELVKTKKMLNEVENKAKTQINLEIQKSKSLINEITKDKDLDFKTKKEKISEIKRNLNKTIGMIENSVVEEVKAIVEQQYEKTDLLLGSVNP